MYTMENPKYREARKRAEELLSKMTLEEKIVQLTQYIGSDHSYNPESKDEEGSNNAGKCGSLLAICGVAEVNKMQEIALEYTPHSIPIITGNDVIHGFRTTMPIPLAMSCSFEPDVVRSCFRAAGLEAKEENIHWAYAPMVDVARDSRWGRVAEGFGEDPVLASHMAEAAVHGYQDDAGIMACMKHFVAYSACEGGRDYAGCQMSEHELFNTYIPPFQAGVDAGVATFMASFNEINGVPVSGNRHIMTEVLRDKMGFDGFVVSDYDSVHELVNHGYAEDFKDAAYKGFNAGVDVVMSGNLYNKYLPELVAEGKITEEQIDYSALRVLTAKYMCGVMDKPFLEMPTDRKGLCKEHKEIAYNAAVKSMVLLENNGVLPAAKDSLKGKKIGVCGPYGDDRNSVLGCWSSIKDINSTVSVKMGLEEVYTESEIVYESGITVSGEDTSIDKAVSKMAECDIIFAVLGEWCGDSGEATSRTDLTLPTDQLELLDRLSTLGKQVVVLITAGRPLIMTEVKDKCDALLYIWAPGTACGKAAAAIISGAYNPTGRTTVSFPRSTGQCPIYYNRTSTGRPARDDNFFTSKYIDCEIGPLYPFGYGLGYADFEISAEIDKNVININGEITVNVTVKNTGKYDGSDVVQLYTRDISASITRPVRELKNYKKVFVKAGETENFTFTLKAADLAFWNAEMQYRTEPGKFKMWIANHSEDNSAEFDFEVI